MRTIWVLIDRLGLLFFALGLTAPFLGAGIGAWASGRRSRRGSPRRAGALVGGGLAAGLVVAPFCLWLAMCSPPVGRGAAAEWWYERLAPVVAGLDRFHAERGAYPSTLTELVPRYLAPDLLSEVRVGTEPPVEYRTSGGSYELTFSYHGPGVNHCTYRPDGAGWRCGGYF